MSRTRTGLAVVAALAAVGFAAPAAQAGGHKQYAVHIETPKPAHVHHSQRFTVTIKNLAAQQRIGAVNLAVPKEEPHRVDAVLRSTNLNGASITTDGSVVRIRDAAIAPGITATLELEVNTGLVDPGGAYAWSVAAVQANDFNGPPGNAFTLSQGSSLNPTLTRPAETGGDSCPADDTTCSVTVSYRDAHATVTLTAEGTLAEGTQPTSSDTRSSAAALATDATSTLVAHFIGPEEASTDPRFLNEADCFALPQLPSFTLYSPATGLVTGPTTHEKTVTFHVDRKEAITTPSPGICYAGPLPSVPADPYVSGAPFSHGNPPSLFFPAILRTCDGIDSDSEPDAFAEFSACMDPAPAVDADGNLTFVVKVPDFFPDPVYRG